MKLFEEDDEFKMGKTKNNKTTKIVIKVLAAEVPAFFCCVGLGLDLSDGGVCGLSKCDEFSVSSCNRKV